MTEGKICAKCGASFGCGAKDEKPCWCADLPKVMPLEEGDCLCPECLKKEISRTVARLGECADCAHAQRLKSKGGDTLILCGLSKADAKFEKYPRLPRSGCSGHSAGPSK
jgi:hypothetical protein